MYVIGFNGPPRSGKDTLAGLLVKELQTRHADLPVLETSLSTPLRRVAYEITGVHGGLQGADYESFKERSFPLLGGITGRKILIDVSERFLKPCYGRDVMAKLWLESLPDWCYSVPCLVMIRDSGFQYEVDPIIEAVGPDNFLVCRVHRPGTDFSNDSREWVTHPTPAMNTDIYNDGDLENLSVQAGRLYGRLVNQKGWALV